MKLPRDATIAMTKMTEYLLRWRPEDDKSAFLARAGYSTGNADELITDIREQLLPIEAEFIEATEYGPKYLIRGALVGPNGHSLRVISIWMTEDAIGETKFLTLYPDRI